MGTNMMGRRVKERTALNYNFHADAQRARRKEVRRADWAPTDERNDKCIRH
jgi:hypothetical protein